MRPVHWLSSSVGSPRSAALSLTHSRLSSQMTRAQGGTRASECVESPLTAHVLTELATRMLLAPSLFAPSWRAIRMLHQASMHLPPLSPHRVSRPLARRWDSRLTDTLWRTPCPTAAILHTTASHWSTGTGRRAERHRFVYRAFHSHPKCMAPDGGCEEPTSCERCPAAPTYPDSAADAFPCADWLLRWRLLLRKDTAE